MCILLCDCVFRTGCVFVCVATRALGVCGTGRWVAPLGKVCVTRMLMCTCAPLCLHCKLESVSSWVPVCVALSPLQLLDQELEHELLAHHPAAHSLCHWGEWWRERGRGSSDGPGVVLGGGLGKSEHLERASSHSPICPAGEFPHLYPSHLHCGVQTESQSHVQDRHQVQVM